MNDPFAIAWKYHSLGRSVIPSGGGEKGKGALVKWEPYQARSPSDIEVESWHNELHPKIWAMITGHISGVFVVDCDSPEATALFDLGGIKPHVRTPRGGSHYYFQYPQFKVETRAGVLPKIDIRGEGGYVNFCGGAYQGLIVPTKKTLYDITKLPHQILTAMSQASSRSPSLSSPVQQFTEGNRNQRLTSLAGAMRKRGMSLTAMKSALLATNTEQCEPPLEEKEVLQIAQSVGRYEPEAPKTPEVKIVPQLALSIQAGIYAFAWGMFTASLSRVKEHRDGRTTGELKVVMSNSSPVILLQSSLNLLSPRSREAAAKDLDRKAPSMDWDSILETLCTETLDAMRGGEPVQSLVVEWEHTKLARPKYVVYPLVVGELPNCIFGDPGSLKSTMALVLSQVAMLCWRDNPLGLPPPQEPVRGLYLDYETDEDTMKYQMKRIGKGMKLDLTQLTYRRCSVPLSSELDQICHHIEDSKAEMIIIDSLAMASGGEPKETESALRFFSALRQIKTATGRLVTPLILAHNAKDPEAKKKSIYGNQMYTAQMRNIWEAVSRSEPGDDVVDLVLFHRKPPPFGKFLKPLGWKFIFNDAAETIEIVESDPRTIGEFLERMSAGQRILVALKSGKLTAQELMTDLKLERSAVDTALSRLKRSKQVIKDGNFWGLLYQGGD